MPSYTQRAAALRAQFAPLVEQLAADTVELPNKAAWQVISAALAEQPALGRYARRRGAYAKDVWAVRARLQADRSLAAKEVDG
jgi:hypothetical protein